MVRKEQNITITNLFNTGQAKDLLIINNKDPKLVDEIEKVLQNRTGRSGSMSMRTIRFAREPKDFLVLQVGWEKDGSLDPERTAINIHLDKDIPDSDIRGPLEVISAKSKFFRKPSKDT